MVAGVVPPETAAGVVIALTRGINGGDVDTEFISGNTGTGVRAKIVTGCIILSDRLDARGWFPDNRIRRRFRRFGTAQRWLLVRTEYFGWWEPRNVTHIIKVTKDHSVTRPAMPHEVRSQCGLGNSVVLGSVYDKRKFCEALTGAIESYNGAAIWSI